MCKVHQTKERKEKKRIFLHRIESDIFFPIGRSSTEIRVSYKTTFFFSTFYPVNTCSGVPKKKSII